MTDRRARLNVLYTSIDARVAATHAASTDRWPCTIGCDTCCHNLSKVPEITDAEWDLLAASIAYSPAYHPLFAARIDALKGAETGPVVCPFLAPEDGVARPGSCLVYDGRPAACRTYGYYAERGDLLGCATILAHDNDGAAGVVWGNQLVVDRELDALCIDSSEGQRSIVARFQERFR